MSETEPQLLQQYQKLVDGADNFYDVCYQRPQLIKIVGHGTFAHVVETSIPGRAIKFLKKPQLEGLALELQIIQRLSKSSYVVRYLGSICHNTVPIGIVGCFYFDCGNW